MTFITDLINYTELEESIDRYIQTMLFKDQLDYKYFDILESMTEQEFDDFFNKLIKKYSKPVYQVYGQKNRFILINLIYRYIKHKGTNIGDDINIIFDNTSYSYCNWRACCINGQGTIIKIYYNNQQVFQW